MNEWIISFVCVCVVLTTH